MKESIIPQTEYSPSIKSHTMQATIDYTTVGYGDVSTVSVTHADIYSIIQCPSDIDIVNQDIFKG